MTHFQGKEPKAALQLIKRVSLQGVPAASAMEVLNDRIFIAGDDSSSLHIYDLDLNPIKKVSLFPLQYEDPTRIPKQVKADLEAICSFVFRGQEVVFVIGSGSISGKRDKGYLVTVEAENQITEVDLTAFYSKLRAQAELLRGDALNIEGLVVLGDKLVFLQRRSKSGNNLAISINLAAFKDWLENQREKFPDYCVARFKLPEIQGREAGFSGAMAHPDGHSILATCVVELSDDAISDGEVLGSFIAEITLDGAAGDVARPERVYEIVLPAWQGMVKLESIALFRDANSHLEIGTVSDDDSGGSELFVFQIPR